MRIATATGLVVAVSTKDDFLRTQRAGFLRRHKDLTIRREKHVSCLCMRKQRALSHTHGSINQHSPQPRVNISTASRRIRRTALVMPHRREGRTDRRARRQR